MKRIAKTRRPAKPRIVCLTNAYDQQYHDWRGERVRRCLSQSKRRDLFRCFELAFETEVMVLSSHPPASDRRTGRWLPAVESRFSNHRQLFCSIWDFPKLRIPFSWVSYTAHVVRHTRKGDILILDNYEWLYVLAAWSARMVRGVQIVLDFEDGKHLIDRSWCRVLSALGEFAGRPLVRAALLAHPALGARLSARVPTAIVPGFVVPISRRVGISGPEIRFLYSGTLDRTRGVDLLMEAWDRLPKHGWHLDICGSGPLEEEVSQWAKSERWARKITFHRALNSEEYHQLLTSCQVGLNCQRAGDPVSSVTFPSKVFTYLSAGLMVLSSQASSVKEVCGDACSYYSAETGEDLAMAIGRILENGFQVRNQTAESGFSREYSLEGTALRLRALFKSARLI